MFLISLVVDRSTGDLVYLIQGTPHPQRQPEAPLVSATKQAPGRCRGQPGSATCTCWVTSWVVRLRTLVAVNDAPVGEVSRPQVMVRAWAGRAMTCRVSGRGPISSPGVGYAVAVGAPRLGPSGVWAVGGGGGSRGVSCHRRSAC